MAEEFTDEQKARYQELRSAGKSHDEAMAEVTSTQGSTEGDGQGGEQTSGGGTTQPPESTADQTGTTGEGQSSTTTSEPPSSTQEQVGTDTATTDDGTTADNRVDKSPSPATDGPVGTGSDHGHTGSPSNPKTSGGDDNTE